MILFYKGSSVDGFTNNLRLQFQGMAGRLRNLKIDLSLHGLTTEAE